MLTTLREKSQVTIPKEVVAMASLQKGDNLNVEFIDGKIIITPVLIVDKRSVEVWKEMDIIYDKYEETFKGLRSR